MSYPNFKDSIDYLGYKVKDKITGMTGVATSVCFDLYGCVQITVSPGLGKDNKPGDSFWIDIQRLKILDSNERVMTPPTFDDSKPSAYEHGPAEKPRLHKI